MIKSPRQLFQENPDAVKEHAAMVDKSITARSLQVAFAELCWNLPPADNVNTSWAANARRQGAQEFIRIFLGLADQQPPRKQRPAGELEPET